jgi:hypothetical protein
MTDAIAAAVLLSLLAVGIVVAAVSLRRCLHRRDDERTQRDLQRSIDRARGVVR